MKNRNFGIISFIILLISVAAVIAERVYLWRNCMSYSTGFYLTGTEAARWGFNLTVISAIAIQAVIAFISYRSFAKSGESCYENPEKISQKSGRFMGIIQLAIGIMLMWSAVETFSLMFGGKAPEVLDIIEGILAFVSSFVFLASCVDQLMKKPVSSKTGYSFVICTLWLGFRAAGVFKDFTTVTTLSQQFLSLMSVLSALLFMTNYARLFSGLSKLSTQSKLVVTGTLTVIFSFSSTIPVYISKALDYRIPTGNFAVDAVDALIGVFALIVLWRVMTVKEETALKDDISGE